MAAYGRIKDLQEVKADTWLESAKQDTEAFLRDMGWGGQKSEPEPVGLTLPSVFTQSDEEYHASAPWRDLDPAPQPSRTDTTSSATGVAPARAASGTPAAMPTSGAGEVNSQPSTSAPVSMSAPPSGGGVIDNSSREAFVRTAWPHMLQAAGGNRDAAEMMLAAAISENGSVGSGRPIWANNFFGIKGKGDAGSANAATWEQTPNGPIHINDDFAAYSSPVAGFRAFFDFLQNNSRYAPALQRFQQSGDASQLFRDVNAAGYATDPSWAAKVENIRANQVAPVVRGASPNAGASSPSAPAAPAASASSPAQDAAGAPWSPDSPAGPGAYSAPAGRAGGGGVQMSFSQPTAGPDTTPDVPSTSSYNDPTDQGTQSQPLPTSVEPSYNDPTDGGTQTQPLPPSYADAGPATDGTPVMMASGPPTPEETAGLQGTQVPDLAVASSYNDPTAGGTQDRPLPAAVDESGGVLSTIGNIVGPAAQKASESIGQSVQPAQDVQGAIRQGVPMVRGLQMVQDAISAFGDETGRRVAQSLGIPDEVLVTVFGMPITTHDVAGFAGATVLDPTNYIGAGEAPAAARAVAPVVRDAAVDAAQAVGRGARALGEEAAYQATFGPGSAAQHIVEPGERIATQATEAPTEPAPTFYSALRRAIEDKMPNRAGPGQVAAIVKGGGVKPDELAWTGFDDWLRSQKGPITKQQALDFLDQNAVRVEEVVKGNTVTVKDLGPDVGGGRWAVVDGDGNVLQRYYDQNDAVVASRSKQPSVADKTKYSQYTLPGGENYRELLLTLPRKGDGPPLTAAERAEHQRLDRLDGYGRLPDEDRERYMDLQRRVSREINAFSDQSAYRSAHWEEPNVLAHVRFTERTAPDGKRVLMLEEVQSDWHQAGRKQGYGTGRTIEQIQADLNDAYRRGDREAVARINQEAVQNEKGVPDAPFKKTWPELAIKRMIRWAAENGYDQIAWSPGQVHAERYSLAQHADEVRYVTKDGATGTLTASKGGSEIFSQQVPSDKLGDYVGQEVAARLMSQEPDIRHYGDEYTLQGRDLATVGGEGMKGFYDQILPQTVQKLGKKFGARVGQSEIGTFGAKAEGVHPAFADLVATGRRETVHSMDITPQMRQSVMQEGQPLFAAPGVSASAGIIGDVANSLGGGVMGAATGAALPADTPEERRRNALIGAGVGMVGGPIAGRLLPRTGGALATPGVGPRGHYDPRLAREPVLPGFEPPRTEPRLPEAVGDAEAQARMRAQGDYLPGMDRIDPLTDPTRVPAAGERAAQPAQTMAEALPGMVRQLQRPPVGTVTNSKGQQSMLAALAPNPGPIRRVAAAVAEATAPWANRVNILRYAGMLSDTATHAFNLTSNGLLQTLDVATTPVAATLDVGRVAGAKAINRAAGTELPTGRQVFFREVPARLIGMRAGAGVGLRAAADILGTGTVAEDATRLDQAVRGFGTDIPGLAPAGSTAANAVNFAVEAPLRALAASDAVFRSTAFGGHLMAEAYAAAAKANGGKVPTDAMIRAAAQTPEVLERVANLGARSVLQEDRALTQAYQRFLKDSGPVGAAVSVEVPFVRTPYNVVAQGVGLTPIGLAGAIKDMAQGEKPARHIEHTIARAMIGTALMVPAAAAYGGGELTGPRPTDPKEASTLPPGWQPWSRKRTIGGTTTYTSLSLEGPLAMPAVLAVLMGEAKKKNPSANMLETAGQVAMGLGQYAEQASFFQGVSNIAQMLDPRASSSVLDRAREQIAAQFSPHIIGGGALGREIQRVMGQPLRDPDGAIEALLATFPYQDQLARATGRQPVAARQDVLGRPVVQTGDSTVARAISPLARTSVERDAGVIRAFRRAGVGLPLAAPKQINDPTMGGAPTSLTSKQQHQWRRAFGDALSEGWDNRGGPEQDTELEKIEAAARKIANDTVLGLR